MVEGFGRGERGVGREGAVWGRGKRGWRKGERGGVGRKGGMWCTVQCLPNCVNINREYTESGTGRH